MNRNALENDSQNEESYGELNIGEGDSNVGPYLEIACVTQSLWVLERLHALTPCQ